MLSTPPAALAASTEQLGRALRIRLAARDAFDVPLAHHVGEAVRAEDDAIAGDDVERVHVDIDVGVHTERAGDDRALRVRLRLFRGQAPLTDELADEAVIVGELPQRAVVQEVRARVADVADEQAAAAGDDDRRHRGSHAGELRVAGRPFEDRLVGEGDRVVDRPAVRHRGAQRFDRSPRGDLARDVTAHPVGDREQREPIVDDVRVLVVVAHAAPRPRTLPAEASCSFGAQHRVADLELVALADTRRLARPACRSGTSRSWSRGPRGRADRLAR